MQVVSACEPQSKSNPSGHEKKTSNTMNDHPLVTIAIPTYNRAFLLKRAAESALAQTHSHLELLISDDASSDGTPEICNELASRDQRVHYFRHAKNIGLSRNFAYGFGRSTGSFFMWLADDDWLDPDYLATCLRAFDTDRDLAIACGQVRYEEDGRVLGTSRPVNLRQESAPLRVLSFFRTVKHNPALYGLMPRSVLSSVPVMKQTFGDDWLLVASIALRGHVATFTETTLHRSASGLSADVTALARYYDFSGRTAAGIYNRLALAVFRDIAWDSSAYRQLSRFQRVLLGAGCGASVSIRYSAVSWRIRYLGPIKRGALQVIGRLGF